ncbi:SCO family protein [Bacillota bacterium Lsc_1132]
MKYLLKLTLFLLTVLFLSACGQQGIKDAKNWPIENFTFTSQDNKQASLTDLKGKVWVSDFIFTSCTDICPPMTANMVKLQKKVKDEKIKNIEFVSFSVDPTVDSPEKLRNFAKQYGADTKNWTFLTGYSQTEIEDFARNNFKTLVKKPQEGDQVIHGTDFYLVGSDGKIKKYYDGFKNIPFNEIISDIKALQ